MIIKMISGMSGDGKTTELLKELNSGVRNESVREGLRILFSAELDHGDICDLINNLNMHNHNINTDYVKQYQASAYKSITERTGILKDCYTLLIDDPSIDDVQLRVIIDIAKKAGVKKLCYTVQLSKRGELRYDESRI